MTLATVLTTLVAALRPLVGGRVYPRSFLQPDGGLPVWPAIRYTVVGATRHADAEGVSDDGEGDDYRIQIDIVSAAAAGETQTQALRAQVQTAIMALGRTYVLDDGLLDEYDEETRTNRTLLFLMVYTSSGG